MLTIRLQRIGKKGQPSYRLVVAPSRSKLIAPPTEDLGSYNPFTKEVTFKGDRVKHWISVGAQPTVTVHNLLVKHGVLTSPKQRVYMKQVVAKAAAPAESDSAPVEKEAPAAEAEAAPAESDSAPAEVAAE